MEADKKIICKMNFAEKLNLEDKKFGIALCMIICRAVLNQKNDCFEEKMKSKLSVGKPVKRTFADDAAAFVDYRKKIGAFIFESQLDS